MAIARYLARKANLQGSNDADYTMSEQLVEEQMDIYNTCAKVGPPKFFLRELLITILPFLI